MKIFFIAPLSSTGGQTLVSKELLKYVSKKNKIIPIDLSLSSNHYGNFTIKRLIKVLNIFIKIFYCQRKVDRIYLTLSQSFLGNIKDLIIFIILFKKIDKFILHLHGGAIGEKIFSKNKLLRVTNFFFYKKVKKIIISGKSHNKIFPKYIYKKIKIIKNFAPDEMFISNKNIESKFNNFSKIKILFLSNMMPEKGYLKLLEGFKLLNKKYKKKIVLDYVGQFYDQKLKEYFLEKIKNEENIFYHGRVEEDLKKKLFSQSHIFCLPTNFLEGQPISILEAYASGNIVMTTNKPGIKDIFIDEVNGFALKNLDSLHIKNKLEFLIKDMKLCKKIAIKNRRIASSFYKKNLYLESVENEIY